MKYQVSVKDANREGSYLRAWATVVFDEAVKVSGIKIGVNSKTGENFISMPNYRNKDGEYKDIAFPVTKEFREELYAAIYAAYDRMCYTEREYSTYFCNADSKEQLQPSVRVTPVEKEGSRLKGLATITLNDSFCINNVAIKESAKGGMFVSYPNRETNELKDGRPVYKGICYPITQKSREELDGMIKTAYQEALERGKEPLQAEKTGGYLEVAPDKPRKKKTEKSR